MSCSFRKDHADVLRHIGVSQKSLDPLQSVVDNETFQQLMTLEQGVAEVFKKHTEVRRV